MPHQRTVELTSGTVMVVTDLHGHGPAYDQIKQIFLAGQANGTIDRLLICGDLLHAPDPTDPADDSLRLLTDVMALQAEHGPETVTLLCGNHEFPHIYGQPLLRGDTDMTSRFEAALSASGRRTEITAFLAGLPFYALTAAGVLVTHAGPTHEIATPEVAAQVLDFDHHALLAEIDAQLAQYDRDHARSIYAKQYGTDYPTLANRLLAATPTDPHYDHLLRAFFLQDDARYKLLWNTLFARNEQVLPNDLRRIEIYEAIVAGFLAAVSANAPALPQHIVVSGHIATNGGHQVVDDHHLRVSSHAHAKPPTKGQYLLLDAAGHYADADALVPHLRWTFP